MNSMRLRCFLDGDSLCIVRDDFENLQEDMAVFVQLDKTQIKLINAMNPKYCIKCGCQVIGYTSRKGLCDECEGK